MRKRYALACGIRRVWIENINKQIAMLQSDHDGSDFTPMIFGWCRWGNAEVACKMSTARCQVTSLEQKSKTFIILKILNNCELRIYLFALERLLRVL